MAQVKSIRSLEELKNPEFNYFFAFTINLRETNRTKIQKSITDVTGDTKGSVYLRRILELKNDALEIMCNDAVYDAQSGTYKPNAGGRKREADAAKKFKLGEVIGLIKGLCRTRNILLKSDLLVILEKANHPVECLTEKEFFEALDFLSSIGVKIIDNVDTKIPIVNYQSIEKYLKTLEYPSLYAFLSESGKTITANSSLQEIKEAADLVPTKLKTNKLGKVQAISGIRSIVHAYLCKDAESKRMYDWYLATKTIFWDELELRKKYGQTEITMEEYTDFVQKLVDVLQISVSEAEKLVGIACKQYQLTLVGSTSEKNNLLECPYDDCGKLYLKGAKNCPHCKRPLEVLCWNCGQKMALTKEDKGCTACGATNYAQQVFDVKCRELEQLLQTKNVPLSALRSKLLEIKNVVPSYASKPQSSVFRRIQELEKDVQKRIKEEETTGEKYRDEVRKIQGLMSQKRYQEAYGMAISLQRKYGTYDLATSRKLIADIQAVLYKAQQYLQMAKTAAANKDDNAAVSYAVKALEICEDYEDARQILKKYPPKPVFNLRVSLKGNKIRLEWDDDVKRDNASYTVIKKVGVAPMNVDDGIVLETGLSIKFFEDANVSPATPYYYAVCVERYGIKSAMCCTFTPIILYADVANVQQVFTPSGVKVSWETPQNVKSVEVWKNVGSNAPLKAGEGVRVTCTPNGFIDERCTGNNAYLILCNYQIKDRTMQSKGVRVVFKPFEHVSPLKNISIQPIGGNKYVFRCDPGYSGTVSIYFADSKLPVPTDKVLRSTDFYTVCKGMIKLSTGRTLDGQVSFVVPSGKIGQIYPIVATEQLFIVSKSHLVNTMGETSFTHKHSNGTVTIAGVLNPKANGVLVKVGHQRYANSVEDEGEKFTYKRDVFNRQGKIELKLQMNTVNYITVFTEYLQDGIYSYSQPMKIEPAIDYREAIDVLYCIGYSVSSTKPFKITIRFEANKETVIPELLLMKGDPTPLNRNVGELCEKLPELTLKKGVFSQKYTGKHVVTVDPVSRTTKFVIFVNKEGGHVRLREVMDL